MKLTAETIIGLSNNGFVIIGQFNNGFIIKAQSNIFLISRRMSILKEKYSTIGYLINLQTINSNANFYLFLYDAMYLQKLSSI